jgi:hypothetical protein
VVLIKYPVKDSTEKSTGRRVSEEDPQGNNTSGKGRFTKKGQGKGKSQKKGSNSNTSTASKKQYVTDYNYYLDSSKHASDYETTTEFLINHIKKLYDYGSNIGSALEELESNDTTAWKPSMQVSGESDESICAIENQQFAPDRVQVGLRRLSKAHAGL